VAQKVEEVIAFERVGLQYVPNQFVFQGLGFRIFAGDFYFLIGASGAGKSSLLKLMYLGHKPTLGQVKVFGQDTALIPREQVALFRQKIGVVFQDFRLLDHLSVLENVLLPLRVLGRDTQTSYHQAVELLTWVGLADYLDAYPSTLSGGQKQRVAIARAVITKPKLLLADEPTGNVDGEIALKLLHLFEELNRGGTAVIIATHNQALVERFSYPVFELVDGRLTLQIRTGGVYASNYS
jgi:cell division transport system ATP-binding protein